MSLMTCAHSVLRAFYIPGREAPQGYPTNVGRCYAFAAVITEGCDHAMRVSADGGACECPTCGAHCPGRFPACESIVQKPGYVPANAPDWAVHCLEPPVAAERGGGQHRRGRAANNAVVETPDEVVALVRTELAATTDELRAITSQAVANLKTGDRDSAVLGAWVEDAIEQAQSRLGDALTAQLMQALRPMMQQYRAELFEAIDAVRFELTERTRELSGEQKRLHDLYHEVATGRLDEGGASGTVAEGLARVATRVGRLERSLGITPQE